MDRLGLEKTTTTTTEDDDDDHDDDDDDDEEEEDDDNDGFGLFWAVFGCVGPFWVLRTVLLAAVKRVLGRFRPYRTVQGRFWAVLAVPGRFGPF
jgi:hypothetical protein